ncbi:protein of unknown function [Haloechinothrix alba]|uniref:DUF4328 domain-containing protein n=1 Tax=Haloechinothrix alba TaxID=664784 RepID=A0A238V1G7_9PSEU|nr:DUF4328 domain-containing protein [Haloechinothrix alba]SNR28412.1 protein of unknown function [Haloechinothrix alba]
MPDTRRQPEATVRRWVAVPPVSPRRGRPEPPERPYTGPPSYPAPPRWGFPSVTWRWPTSVPGTVTEHADPVRRQWVLGGRVLVLLIITATLAALATGAEVWRYVLLVRSRDSALNSSMVLSSDALVVSASVLLFIVAVVTIAATYLWILRVRAAIAEQRGVDPPRSAWRIAAGLFVPGVNWVLAGPIAAELEHLASGYSATARPRPSWLVLAWWAAWAANGVLVTVTLLWRTRDGIQVQADSVLLTAITDLAALLLAALTVLLVRRVMSLLAPMAAARLRGSWVAAVRDAPPPELRPRRTPWARR